MEITLGYDFARPREAPLCQHQEQEFPFRFSKCHTNSSASARISKCENGHYLDQLKEGTYFTNTFKKGNAAKI